MTRTRLTITTVSFHSSSSSFFWSKVSVNYSTLYKNNQSVFVLVGAVDPVLSSTKGDNKTRLYVLQSHPFCFPFLSLSLFQPLFFSRKHRFRCNGRKHLTQFILFFFKMQLLLMRWNTRAPNTNTHTHTYLKVDRDATLQLNLVSFSHDKGLTSESEVCLRFQEIVLQSDPHMHS